MGCLRVSSACGQHAMHAIIVQGHALTHALQPACNRLVAWQPEREQLGGLLRRTMRGIRHRSILSARSAHAPVSLRRLREAWRTDAHGLISTDFKPTVLVHSCP